MNRDLTIFCTAIREIKHFIIVIRDFTDSRGRDLAISCTVLREFLYFRAMIREPGIFPNVIHDLKVPWEGLFNLFWSRSLENYEVSKYNVILHFLRDSLFNDYEINESPTGTHGKE